MVSKIRDETSNKQYVSGKEKKKSLRNRKLKRSCFVLFFFNTQVKFSPGSYPLKDSSGFLQQRERCCLDLTVSPLLWILFPPTVASIPIHNDPHVPTAIANAHSCWWGLSFPSHFFGVCPQPAATSLTVKELPTETMRSLPADSARLWLSQDLLGPREGCN